MDNTRIRVMKLREGMPDNPLAYASEGSSGMDIRAWPDEPITLEAGEIRLIPTGIAVSIPEGFEAQVRPRSGLALKNGLGILNAPGTIDSDYRGEIGIILINWGKDSFTVNRGDRIAQMVIARVCRAELLEVSCLDETGRGAGGFGHSGIH
jgi:dUTP pyrophosphatase